MILSKVEHLLSLKGRKGMEQKYYTTYFIIYQQILQIYYENITDLLQSLSNTIGSFVLLLTILGKLIYILIVIPSFKKDNSS